MTCRVYIAILDGRVQPTLMLDKQPVATTLASLLALNGGERQLEVELSESH